MAGSNRDIILDNLPERRRPPRLVHHPCAFFNGHDKGDILMFGQSLNFIAVDTGFCAGKVNAVLQREHDFLRCHAILFRPDNGSPRAAAFC